MINEKVKEWAVKANPSSKQIYDVADSWPYNCAAWSGEDISELVRIIVKETIKVVENSNIPCAITTHDLGIVDCSRAVIIQQIKKHFDYKTRFPETD